MNKFFKFKFLLFYLFIYAIVSCHHAIAQSIIRNQSVEITSKDIKFLVYLPKDYYNDDQNFPLLLFLHGLGEKGENIEVVKRHGPPKLIKNREWNSELPFIVISPQLPSKYNNWPKTLINNVLEEVIQRYKVNAKKVYLTGLSLGGIATWDYAVHYPHKLAAIVPVCGKGNPSLACNLGNLPVWAFHGDQDKIVKPEGSIRMINALQNCSDRTRSNTKLTVYPNVGHNSWVKAYDDSSMYAWLLESENEKAKLDSVSMPKTIGSSSVILKELCQLPAALPESSGLQYYSNGLVWAHNDSGHQPVIYQIDTTGKVNQFKRITNAANFDWEDLAKDKEGNLYIGDFGNNKNNRKSFQIYKIGNPENIEEERIAAEVITYTYPDQREFPPSENQLNFDVEAMIAFNDNLYLFTKNRTVPYSGYVKLYKVPTAPGEYTAELMDSLLLDKNHMLVDWVTGADISPDEKKIALLTSNKVWLLHDFKDDEFFKGKTTSIQLPHITQKEGITFINNKEVYICDELFQNFLGGKLYQLDLSPYINP